MAEIIKIDLAFNLDGDVNGGKLLTIPEKITVPQFSVVQWNIKNFEEYKELTHRYRRSLIFTIYFEKESPFYWKRNFVQLYDFPFGHFYPYNNIRLAESVAEKNGDYKYGVSIQDAEQNETLFDEDPIISVF